MRRRRRRADVEPRPCCGTAVGDVDDDAAELRLRSLVLRLHGEEHYQERYGPVCEHVLADVEESAYERKEAEAAVRSVVVPFMRRPKDGT